MNHEMDSIIRAFLNAKAAKEAAEAEYNNIRDMILVAMGDQKSYTGTFAKVAIVSRKHYLYPPEIIIQEENLKAAKKAAERIGTAKLLGPTIYPRVTVTE